MGLATSGEAVVYARRDNEDLPLVPEKEAIPLHTHRLVLDLRKRGRVSHCKTDICLTNSGREVNMDKTSHG
eukprot:757680-Hanusia_phi.AAC.1